MTKSNAPLLGQLGVVGFQGTSPKDPGVQEVCRLATQGLIGGVIFFRHNLIERQQIQDLLGAFKELTVDYPLLLSIDQEGGSGDFGQRGVQRLWAGNGFHNYPTALTLAQDYTPQEAYDIYAAMAYDVKEAGFNVVWGPVVDLHKANSQAIGQLRRSYGRNPEHVVAYAKAYIQAFSDQGVLTCLKHFPGHGLAEQDSHKGLVDITLTHHPDELVPFQNLVEKGYNHMIMSAHVMHQAYSRQYPATLCAELLQPLLNRDFQGVFVSDDLMMGGIIDHFSLSTAATKALQAGIHLLILSWNKQASQGATTFKDQGHEELLEALEQSLDPCLIEKAFQRVVRLKRLLI